jgi:hypothetical protein
MFRDNDRYQRFYPKKKEENKKEKGMKSIHWVLVALLSVLLLVVTMAGLPVYNVWQQGDWQGRLN